MLMNDCCNIKPKNLTANMPAKYKNLVISNYIIYQKIKTLCNLIPNVDTAEQNKIKPVIDKLLDEWKKNDLEITIEERHVKPIDPYNREFRITTTNMGAISLEPCSNPSEEVIECPSNIDFDPYEFIAINLEPSSKLFETEYMGENQSIDYGNMNYKLTKNSIQDEDRIFY